MQALKDEISQLKQEAATAQEKLSEKEAAAETSSKRVSCLLQVQSRAFVDSTVTGSSSRRKFACS